MEQGFALLAATGVAFWHWATWGLSRPEAPVAPAVDSTCRCICQVERESLPLAAWSFHHAGLALAGVCILLCGCCCGAAASCLVFKSYGGSEGNTIRLAPKVAKRLSLYE